MAKRVKLDDLGEAIRDILDEYAGDVIEGTEKAVRATLKTGVAELRSASNSAFDPAHQRSQGRYGSGWISTTETGRTSAQGWIYNGKYPGLPHLLEHGHAKRGGGRVSGREHIAPVEEKLVREFETAVREAIS